MKAFDLDKALAGEPLITRSGRMAGQFRLNEEVKGRTLCAHGDFDDWDHDMDGKCLGLPQYDLFMSEPDDIINEEAEA